MTRIRIPLGQGLNLTESAESLETQVRLFSNGLIDRNNNNKPRPGDTEFADTSCACGIVSLYYWRDTSLLIGIDEKGDSFKVTEDGTSIPLTGGNFQAGVEARFATNGETLYVVNGTSINKLVSAATAFSQVVSSNLPEFISDVAFLDNFLFVSELNTGRFYRSEVLVGSQDPEFVSSQVYTAESNSDNAQRLLALEGSLHIIGNVTTEIWTNKTDGTGPVRVSIKAYGTDIPNTVVQERNQYYLLNSERKLLNRNGEILNGDILDEFSSFGDISNAYSFMYSYKGRLHYVITFPDELKTYALDLSNTQWIRWSEYTSAIDNEIQWKARSYSYVKSWNKHIIGHNKDGKLYELDDKKFVSNVSDIILFKKQIYNLTGGTHGLKVSKSMILKFTTGKGLVNSPDTAAQAILRYRVDGRQWTQEISLNLYEQGREEFFRIIRRIRPFRSLDIEITVSDNVDFEWVGLEFDGYVVEDD